jgi:hypothetical protein
MSMAPRLPLMHKTPFVLDTQPLREATSPHAGLLATSRTFRSLGLRLCASPETVARIAKVWERFPLPTQATCAMPLGREG